MAVVLETPSHTVPPIARTRLIGRESERSGARRLLLDEGVPLLTLTGPGGVGKTRLALACASDVSARFADGVVWVDLAPLADPALVPIALATALGIAPAAGGPVFEVLARYLRSRQTLLIIDNCEHLLEAAADLVAMLLAACPALQVLATSRAPLRVRGEHVLALDALPLPAPETSALETLQQNEAIRLFLERAQAVRPAFRLDDANAPTVAALCRALDGLPLAIELAAPRIAVLSPAALLAEMTGRLSLLTHGARDLPARQQTIAAAIAWSYALLDSEAQALFRQLAVFMGGFTLEAARAVGVTAGQTGHDVAHLLGELIDQSLVRRAEGSEEPRFTMLETIRAFGLEQLAASGEEETARGRHADWFRRLVAGLDLYHANAGDESWYALLQEEQHNLRQTLAWFVVRGDRLGLNDLSAALFKFWLAGSQFAEGRYWLDQAVACDDGLPLLIRSRARGGAGTLAAWQNDYVVAEPLLAQSLALARECGDPVRLAEALIESGALAAWQGDRARGITENEEAERVARDIAPDLPAGPLLRGMALVNQGWMAGQAGDRGAAAARYDEAMPLLRTPGGNWSLSIGLLLRGHLRLAAGILPEATADLLESLALTWMRGDNVYLTRPVRGLAVVAARAGQMPPAASLLGAADAIDRRTGRDLLAGPPDEESVQWCLAELRTGYDDPTIANLRHVGARLTTGQAVALARAAASSVLGETRAAAIWAQSGAPDAGAPDAAVAVLEAAAPSPVADVAEPFALTRRERAVLALLCRRRTDEEIGQELFMSRRTASGHVGNILGKLGAANRREVAALAARHGLI